MREVVIFNHTNKGISCKKYIKEVLNKTLISLDVANYGVSVVIAGDLEMKQLNKFWRRKARPANVLSFPDYFSGKKVKFITQGDKSKYLGEIFINYNHLGRNSFGNNELFQLELKHLLIHSTLHLLGYNHRRGYKLEKKLIKKI